MITLENKKIHDLLIQKDLLVNDGRKLSGEIEKIEGKIKVYENKEKAITGKVKPTKEVEERGQKLTEEINAKIKELEALGNEIDNQKLAAIPKEMKDEHVALMDEKEKLERERNKVALKVQKIKDKVIPVIQKETKPFLKEYDDIETAKVKDGKVVVNTFNHLEDWKRKYRK